MKLSTVKLSTVAVGYAAAACLIGATAHAQTTTYDYTGAAMSGTQIGEIVPPDGSEGSLPYCCAALTGTFTLASPLAPDLVNAQVTPLTATFSFLGLAAGGPLFPANPTMQFGPQGNTPVLFGNTFDLSTNSSGQITAWDLNLGTGAVAGEPHWQATITSTGDAGTYTPPSLHGIGYDLSNAVAGDWSIQGGTQAAPEISPAGAMPAITMLLGVAMVIRGRRRTLRAGAIL